MPYMVPVVEKTSVFVVETNCGTEVIPADLVGRDPSPNDFVDFIEGDDIEDFTLVKNAVVGHMTAPWIHGQVPVVHL